MPMPPSIPPSRHAVLAYRFMLAAWGILLLLICIRSAIWPTRNSTYMIFANAAENWVHGKNLYDNSFLLIGLDQYRYAPLVTVFFVPFSMLPDSAANVLWRLVNMATFFGGMIAFCRTVYPGRARLSFFGAACIGWLIVPLSLSSLNNAQANPLIIGALLLGVVAAYRGRWNWAAVALAVPILFKIYPAAVAMLLLLVYPRQLGWRLALVMAIGLLLPFGMQDPSYVYEQYRQWFEYLAHEDRSLRTITESYRDFWILVRWSHIPLPREVYLPIQLAVAALAAVVVLFGRLRGWASPRLLRHLLDLGCCWIIVFGPATENCTFILLAPTLALAVWEGYATPRPLWTRCLLAAIVCTFACSALVTALPDGRNWVYPLNPLAALLLFVERLVGLRPVSQGEHQENCVTTRPKAA